MLETRSSSHPSFTRFTTTKCLSSESMIARRRASKCSLRRALPGARQRTCDNDRSALSVGATYRRWREHARSYRPGWFLQLLGDNGLAAPLPQHRADGRSIKRHVPRFSARRHRADRSQRTTAQRSRDRERLAPPGAPSVIPAGRRFVKKSPVRRICSLDCRLDAWKCQDGGRRTCASARSPRQSRAWGSLSDALA